MRRGCISLGESHCDNCQGTIPEFARYLVTDEKEDGNVQTFCIKCALEKGYASYKEDKGEKILTFFA